MVSPFAGVSSLPLARATAQGRSLRSRVRLLDDPRGGEATHADRAVHVLVAGAGQIAAGEVDRADRLAQVRAVAVQTSEVEARRVRPAGPLLRRPVALVVDAGILRLGAEVVREGLEDALPALIDRQAEHAIRVPI